MKKIFNIPITETTYFPPGNTTFVASGVSIGSTISGGIFDTTENEGYYTIPTSYNTDATFEYRTNFKFVNKSDNQDPEYAKTNDSGFDLRANLKTMDKFDQLFNAERLEYFLPPLQRVLINTGLFFEIPFGWDMEIKSRSGLANKHGIGVLTGTIDQGYRGEIKVLIINLGNEPFIFKHGDKIAQAVLRPVVSSESVRFHKVDELEPTERNESGFGSSDNKIG